MNEDRIRAIANAASEYAENNVSLYDSIDDDLDLPTKMFKARDLKFAELIVKECMRLNKEQLKAVPTNQADWDGHNYGLTAAVHGFDDIVRDHFGIE